MESLAVIILAAGKGTRMNSDLPKVATPTSEMPLIQHVVGAAAKLAPAHTIIVTGYRREVVEEVVRAGAAAGRYSDRGISFALQDQQLGTGHAVKCALPSLKNFGGTVLILCGDVPLIKTESLKNLLARHHESKATISLLSVKTSIPNSYGRVVRDAGGKFVERIVELKDCTPEQAALDEFNSGIYAVDSAFLAPAVNGLKDENVQREFYLTDIIGIASKEGQTVACLVSHDFEEVQGINTVTELTMVNATLMRRRVDALIAAGVVIEDPASVFVDAEVAVKKGAKIGPQVQLRGKTSIGAGAVIEGCAYLADTVVEDNATVKFSVRSESATIGSGASVGPFANLRPGTVLGANTRVGNFVETKNTTMAAGSKASHLTYLGDCTVGEEANIGAGTITCNYDGYNKFKTKIGKGAFIGSNSSLVAPVEIGDGASIGAGSVISKNVEKDALAFTRAPQVAKEGWAKRKREKTKKS